ncbi:MAG: response regulator transcription factor [Sedimenticola sp.]|nr:response regulator transcription factor [Sedimenticola sp.]MCW8947512.1 response regulator transcription factor [Sedimenticola sp.]MCW8976085.1 response regulator transcription factor [Sedimenticola sp.]MCW9022684.1 response regulator transcription factor [Sedimenticola sp.]MDF1528049.1 response regulator transcription factor [Sedimenticola sp.]
MRVLVVEDEEKLRNQLKQRLVSEGYSVDVATDGEEGLYFAEEYPFDVAVIDLGLPKLSGIELIRSVRNQQIIFPILILTARDNWQDKVEGLEVGGDDYLVKPFNMEELLARLNALLRRSAGFASPQITWGPIAINTAQQQATLEGNEVLLTAYEYKVLEYLMLHAGKVISKSELTEHIYDQDFDRDSNVLEVFIRRLRRKFDPDGELNPIETLRGRGYRFNQLQPPA